MLHFPESIIEDRNHAWDSKTPASIIIYLRDTTNLLKVINAPAPLIAALNSYIETLDHSLDQDGGIEDTTDIDG